MTGKELNDLAHKIALDAEFAIAMSDADDSEALCMKAFLAGWFECAVKHS